MFKSEKFNYILERYKCGRMPHAILLCSNNMDYLDSDLDILIKNIICSSTYESNCKKDCNLCHLIDEGNFPNLVKITPDGLNIKKQQIIELKEKFLGKPLFSKYNIYIIKECDKLNLSSANTILKFLEEPESSILGFYITDNIEKIIPTIKSRCEVINVLYEDNTMIDDNYNQVITDFINYITDKNNDLAFIYTDIFDELNYTRKEFIEMFKNLLYRFEKKYYDNDDSILLSFDINNNSKILELIKNTLLKIESNVNIELAILVFAVELRNLYE